jgi:uncharacterized membrane protein YoaK (UPF0700 family)
VLDALRRHPGNTHLGLMLALTFTTGIVDAVGYLGLDRVFTGNMTGNVVILGMALVGGTGLPVAGPLIALVAFMAGAAVGGRALRGDEHGWTPRHTWLFGAVGLLVLACAVPAIFVDSPGHPLQYAITAALGLAMGCQAATARHIAVKDVTTVVVTSTITGLASDSVLGKGGGQPWRRRAGAIVLIGAGAFAGAALLKIHIGWGMVAAGVIIVAAAVLGHLARPKPPAAEDSGEPYDEE